MVFHEQQCRDRVKCDSCGGCFKRREMKEHRAQCKVDLCRFCGERVPKTSFLNAFSEKTCACGEGFLTMMTCDICGQRVHRQLYTAHCEECESSEKCDGSESQHHDDGGESHDFSAHRWRTNQRPCSSSQRPCSSSQRPWSKRNGRFQGGRTEDLPLLSEELSEAERVIGKIKRRTVNLRSEPLKKMLRIYQLKWHPDKQPENEAVATKVFLFIQQEWEKHFN